MDVHFIAPVVIDLPVDLIGEPTKDVASNADEVQHIIKPRQPLEIILASTRVNFMKGQAESIEDIQCSISSLDVLIDEISSHVCESNSLSLPCTSPGFDTIRNAGTWQPMDAFPHYEFLTAVNRMRNAIPMPSPGTVLEYFQLMRNAWTKRLEWAASSSTARKGNHCSCYGKWQHCSEGQNVLMSLCDQTIEQLMVREAGACLRGLPNIHLWNECYTAETCPSPRSLDSLYLPSTVNLLVDRATYFEAYVSSALEAKSTVDLCICYLFPNDPAARYILLDLLPHVAMQNNVKVRVLFEAMTTESQLLKGAFDIETRSEPFLDELPEKSPPYSRAKKEYQTAAGLIQDFLDTASSIPNIDVRFFFAKDKKEGYRIKNHTKCHIFDGVTNGKVIAGGSNVIVRRGSSDTDFIIQGEIAGMYQRHFDQLWSAMDARSKVEMLIAEEKVEEEKKDCADQAHIDELFVGEQTAQAEPNCSIAKILMLPSQPSSLGEDVILRCVLGAIKEAEKSIVMSMGHCNIPLSFVEALVAATKRGVHVSILVNSLYSCDLRGGQKDLFISLQRMLAAAPEVNLYVTAVKNGVRPDFLHSKYIVVDSKWSAVGSWNLWTRSAFYEMEAEIFVQSEKFAAELHEKFNRERKKFCISVETPNECKKFLPKGCELCQGFGPFYNDER